MQDQDRPQSADATVALWETFTSADEHTKRREIYAAPGNGEISRGRGHGHNMLGAPDNGRNLRNVWTIPTHCRDFGREQDLRQT